MSLSKPGRLGPHTRLTEKTKNALDFAVTAKETLHHVTLYAALPKSGLDRVAAAHSTVTLLIEVAKMSQERIAMLEAELTKVHDYYGTPPRTEFPPSDPHAITW